MRLLTLDRGALVGALVGAASALAGGWLAGVQLDYVPFTVLLVLAIALTGLALGANAAAWAYVVGAVVVIFEALAPHAGSWRFGDTVRLVAFLVGSPAIVYLVHRAETNRRVAEDALAASHQARRQADAERERLARARRSTATRPAG